MLAVKGALCVIVALSVFISAEDDIIEVTDKEWDVLIFTQHWPATVCLDWKKKDTSNSCSLPSQKDAWTIHGIWPTKFGTIGPGFCNNSWHFNSTLLQPIETQLEQFWINIEKDTPLYSLWEHEWKKHGTCAAELPNLDSETKYFTQGLRWLQLYSMSDILLTSGFTPDADKTYKAGDIYDAIKKRIGKNPAMNCQVDSETGKSYMFEIRICFNKSLELVDCDGIKTKGEWMYNSLLHCDPSKPVVYTDIIPHVQQVRSGEDWPLVELYKLVMWIHWLTL